MDLEELEPEPRDLDDVAHELLSKAVRKSPWLALSALFHAGLLALLPLIIFVDKITVPETTPISIAVNARRIDPDRNYKPVTAGPPSFEGDGGDEPTLLFPGARAAERNESADGCDDHAIKGETRDSLVHLEDLALVRGPRGRLLSGPAGTNDSMGVGGGSGTGLRFGGPKGGRSNLAARGGGSAATEAAVAAGLGWLARHQAADGRWRTRHGCDNCGGAGDLDCDVAATSLAVLAFVAAGYDGSGPGLARDPSTGKTLRYGDAVRAALKWLASKQAPTGQWKAHWGAGGWQGAVAMYEQAFATLAFCEAHRATKAVSYRIVAERGLRWLEGARCEGGGWRYVPEDSEGDVSVTGACVQAIRSARLAGVTVSSQALSGALSLVDRLRMGGGQTGYMASRMEWGPASSAIAIFIRSVAGASRVAEAADRVTTDVMKREGYSIQIPHLTGSSDFYLWYYAMLSLFEDEGPSGLHFKKVNGFVTSELCRLQRDSKAGCAAGSWDADPDTFMSRAGRPGATALNVLTLEVYYRYATPEAIANAASPR
jgi:hypothetical protein